MPSGESKKSRASKVTQLEAFMMYMDSLSGMSNGDIARKYGRHETTVSDKVNEIEQQILKRQREMATGKVNVKEINEAFIASIANRNFPVARGVSLPASVNPFEAITDFNEVIKYGHGTGQFVGHAVKAAVSGLTDRDVPYEQRMKTGPLGAGALWSFVIAAAEVWHQASQQPQPKEQRDVIDMGRNPTQETE